MKKIQLGHQKNAAREYSLVDDEDFEKFNQYMWCVFNKKSELKYAARNIYSEATKKWKVIFLHREIMKTPKGFVVDHINHDGLDNRKENLRNCTTAENLRNARRTEDNTSGYKGVCWNKLRKKWYAYACVSGKRIHLGCFFDKEKAARAYDDAAKKYYKEFASLNFK